MSGNEEQGCHQRGEGRLLWPRTWETSALLILGEHSSNPDQDICQQLKRRRDNEARGGGGRENVFTAIQKSSFVDVSMAAAAPEGKREEEGGLLHGGGEEAIDILKGFP